MMSQIVQPFTSFSDKYQTTFREEKVDLDHRDHLVKREIREDMVLMAYLGDPALREILDYLELRDLQAWKDHQGYQE